MADGINFNLLGVGEPSPYQQAQQRDMQNQLAQQQLATGAMQQEKAQLDLAQLKRDQQALRVLQQKFVENGKSPDLETNFRAMMESGIAHYVDIGLKGIQMLEGQKRFRALVGGGLTPSEQGAPQPSEALSQTYAVPDTMSNQLAASTAPAAAAPSANNLADMESKIIAAYEIGTPSAIAWAQAREKELGDLRKPQVVSPGASVYQGGKFVGTAPGKEDTAPAIVRQYNFAKTPEGGNFKGTLLDYERSVAAAGRAPAAPAPVTPVTILDPNDPSKTIVVDARTGRPIGQGVKETGGAPLSAKDRQAREAKYPQATAAVKSFESKTDELIKDLEALISHPGLDGITGIVGGRTPGITKEARAAEALYNKIIARGGFSELQNLRNSSPTGGALGNVSNQEGQQLKSAFAALDRTQDPEDLIANARAAIESLRGAKERTREAYDMTYEYKGTASSANAAPKAMSAEDKQALEWANANPNDPRAAKIKQRLGR